MDEDFDTHYRNGYNTTLSEENTKRFNNWIAAESKRSGKDMSREMDDYDIQGYWLSGGPTNTTSANGHGPDKYKKPNHPTFSDESIYHNTTSPYGTPFQGGKWAQDRDGKNTYTPSATMLQHTHPKDYLQKYMSEIEPDVSLILPE